MVPAIFLDRDGVIIENRSNYVRHWKDVTFYPQAITALQAFSRTNLLIIIVTNQSVVGQKLISLKTAMEINLKIYDHIQANAGRIDGFYICPHTPMDLCSCRKPHPGMLLHAASDFAIDLRRSVLIGDTLSDIRAGHAAGIPKNILVRTGLGMGQRGEGKEPALQPYLVVDTLLEAVAHVDL